MKNTSPSYGRRLTPLMVPSGAIRIRIPSLAFSQTICLSASIIRACGPLRTPTLDVISKRHGRRRSGRGNRRADRDFDGLPGPFPLRQDNSRDCRPAKCVNWRATSPKQNPMCGFAFIGDTAFDANRLRRYLAGRDIEAVIPRCRVAKLLLFGSRNLNELGQL